MIAGGGVYGLSLIAGVLSTLSPCVLPLIPILAGAALTAHRFGPLALAGGLALAYALAGVFLATVGLAIGLDQTVFRNLAAGLSLIFGLILISEPLQMRFAQAVSGLGDGGQVLLDKLSTGSLTGQFWLGALLGIVWSPCVGPTLGSALLLASQGQNLAHAAVVMGLFGVGAALPLVAFGTLSQQAMLQFKSKLLAAGKTGKKLLGMLLLVLGVLVLTGWDKRFEAWAVNASPQWLTDLTISI